MCVGRGAVNAARGRQGCGWRRFLRGLCLWLLLATVHGDKMGIGNEENSPGSPELRANAPSESSRRVAVCFFGLTRSLKFTLESIEENLVGPIQAAGYEVDIFVHTYNLTVLSNNWSDERDQVLNVTEYVLLKPREASVTFQEDFLARRKPELRRCAARGHGWPYVSQDDFSIAQNLLCQLNSIYEVSLLWQKQHQATPYHAIMYARPDVVFNCPFPTQYLDQLQDHTIVVPDHSHYGGLNDRFALAKPDVAALYGRRVDFALDLCPWEPIHAERYTSRWVRTQQFVAVKMPRFDFFRVRANKIVGTADALQLKGCNVNEIYKFPVHERFVELVRRERRAKFHEVTGWAKMPARPRQLRDSTEKVQLKAEGRLPSAPPAGHVA